MIPVKCPHCKVGLKVDETKIPEGISSFKCPKCKQEISVSLLEKKREQHSETETIVLQPLKKECGKLMVLRNADTPEQIFCLLEGISIVGRKASVSEANICIETEDKLMSRSHIRIEVKKNAQGGVIHLLSDNQSKNRTLYNGNYMEKGEIMILKDNDEIVIGHTVLRFNE
ncbi:MAG: FHA domain-containing protein [Tannerella sp.]|jgi:predicted Zn finger-like uncharacterized protein|nr:FHA domain-containing protein [Tannerella sp.]